MTQPFLPFTRPAIDEDTIADVANVLRSGWITSGPKVQAFEAALSALCGGRPVKAFNSGTATLEVALRLAGVEFRDETTRSYPNRTLAAHVIGSVDHEEKGSGGIEFGLQDDLEGIPGTLRLMTDVTHRGYESVVEMPAQPGRNVTLTPPVVSGLVVSLDASKVGTMFQDSAASRRVGGIVSAISGMPTTVTRKSRVNCSSASARRSCSGRLGSMRTVCSCASSHESPASTRSLL